MRNLNNIWEWQRIIDFGARTGELADIKSSGDVAEDPTLEEARDLRGRRMLFKSLPVPL